jgi:hypothetical protein
MELYIAALFLYIFFSSLAMLTVDTARRALVLFTLHIHYFSFISNYEKVHLIEIIYLDKKKSYQPRVIFFDFDDFGEGGY